MSSKILQCTNVLAPVHEQNTVHTSRLKDMYAYKSQKGDLYAVCIVRNGLNAHRVDGHLNHIAHPTMNIHVEIY